MPKKIAVESVEQLHELLSRYGITAEKVGYAGGDILFWTKSTLTNSFFLDFTVDDVSLSGDMMRVAIWNVTKLEA